MTTSNLIDQSSQSSQAGQAGQAGHKLYETMKEWLNKMEYYTDMQYWKGMVRDAVEKFERESENS